MNPETFNPKTSALVVIDLANDFVYAGGAIADAGGPDYQARVQSIIPNLQRLVSAARETGVTVVYTTDAHLPDDCELAKWPPHAMKGSHEAEVVEALKPASGDLVLEKRSYSPFVTSDIGAQLEARGISRLYITGVHTDCCCRHTSADAFQLGYDLVWVPDAMQAFTDEAHRSGVEYLKTWYAIDADRQFQETDAVIKEWRGAAVPATT